MIFTRGVYNNLYVDFTPHFVKVCRGFYGFLLGFLAFSMYSICILQFSREILFSFHAGALCNVHVGCFDC